MSGPTGHPLRIGLEALPLVLAVIIGSYWLAVVKPDTEPARAPAPAAPSPDLEPIPAMPANALETVFADYGYHWPPDEAIPRIAVSGMPAGLGELPVSRRKALFLRTLLPVILAENAVIRRERAMLDRLDDKPPKPETVAYQDLEQLRERYRVDGSISEPGVLSKLRQRVDIIPPALALAQAAIESGWGTSRFAREGNNLFGEWTWDASQGIAPARRAVGSRHYVRRFPGLRLSVRAYMRNLNTHSAYNDLRELRAQAREQDQPLDGAALAAGLGRYSERGQAYVRDVRNMIRQNGLDRVTADRHLRGDD